MNKKKTVMITILTTLIWLAPLRAGTRVYHEKTLDKTDVHNFVYTKTEKGLIVDLKTVKHDGLEITQQFKLYPNLSTWHWEYDCPAKNTKITAIRKGDEIFMTATDRGKKVEKIFEVNELPWNQTFNVGLEKFTMDTKKSMRFWAIGVGGPGNMKITKFKVKRKEFEKITLSQTKEAVETVHMTISLTGLLSLFWTGNYWYRVSDGRFLRYRGKNKRGAPVSVMELISSTE